MKNYGLFAVKFAGVWLALIIGQIAGGVIGQMVTHAATPAFKQDGPFDLMTAMVVSSGLCALVLSAMASSLRRGFWGRAVTVFILLYVLESGLSEIEAIYFNTYLHMPNSLLASMAIGGVKRRQSWRWPVRPCGAETDSRPSGSAAWRGRYR